MQWEDLTHEILLKELQKHYPDVNFKIIDEQIKGRLGKAVEVSFQIGHTDNDIWKSNVLVHCDIQQFKGIPQGFGTAVDCFTELDEMVAYCISTGKKWAGIKDVKKKLINS